MRGWRYWLSASSGLLPTLMAVIPPIGSKSSIGAWAKARGAARSAKSIIVRRRLGRRRKCMIRMEKFLVMALRKFLTNVFEIVIRLVSQEAAFELTQDTFHFGESLLFYCITHDDFEAVRKLFCSRFLPAIQHSLLFRAVEHDINVFLWKVVCFHHALNK